MTQLNIINYEPKHQPIFKALNEAWISKYFRMEAIDYEALNHPDTKILNSGGAILMVEYNGEIVGTCALIKMSPTKYELAKMAVSPTVQGKGIGYQLGMAILEKAKSLGAKTVYLESNTILTPAMKLYEKLGFVEIPRTPAPYERCNIQMEVYFN
ncbi:MAG: GNAT family N-acetyltransferase [Saprospiraceae bacterium]